jgi:outer membrane protein TolC
LVTLAFVSGCAAVETGKEWQGLEQRLKQADTPRLLWIKDQKEAAQVEQLISAALQGGVTQKEAVAIALLNNRSLQAAFEELGVSKADLVQAGLFHNPTLEAMFRFPVRGDETGTNIELGAAFTLSDLWQKPLKAKAAQAALQRATLNLAAQVLRVRRQALLAFNQAYFSGQIKHQILELKHTSQKTVSAAARLRQFGYLTELGELMTQDASVFADLGLAQASLDQKLALARLARVLGLGGHELNLTLSGTPDPPPTQLPPTGQAVSLALKHHPDLQAARANIQQAARQLSLEKARILREVRLGANWERETGGDEVLGPLLEMELPLFDQNQAQIAKAEHRLRQARKSLLALEGTVREQAIEEVEKIKFLSQKIELLHKRLIPLRKRSLDYARKWAGRMQLNQMELLHAQKNYHQANLELVRTELARQQAWARLEHDLGGRLPY